MSAATADIITEENRRTENREFLLLLFKTVFPLLIQALFMQSINFIDQIMVSSLGTHAVAAIGASNKLMSIYNSFLYGSCSGCAMFLAQYWGKKDIKSLQRMFGLTISVTVVTGALFVALVITIPERLIGIFSNDVMVMEQAVDYMVTVCSAYFLMSIIFPLNFLLRSMNKVKVTMTNTIISVFINCIVNYVLIYGKFGFPAMGVKGAAIATVMCRVVEFTILLGYIVFSKNPAFRNLKNCFSYNLEYVKGFVKKAVPLIGNEMMWSLGTTIYFIIYGKAGTDALAAMSIMQTLQMLAKIATGGFCGASSIIIGNEIGRGDEEKVYRYCRKFHIAALIVGIVSAIAILLLISPVARLYDIEGTQVGIYVAQCMMVLAVYIIMNSCNSINVEGIFRSGGDVGYVTLMDTGSIWLVGMPFTVIAGLVLHTDVVMIYCAHLVLEVYKLVLGHFRFKSGKWLHRLHKVGSEDADTGKVRTVSA